MLPRVNPNASAPDTVPVFQPITGAELDANAHVPNNLYAGGPVQTAANYSQSGTWLPMGGERAFPDKLAPVMAFSEGSGNPYRPMYTLSPYQFVEKAGPGQPRPPIGTHSIAGPAGPVITAPPGTVTLPQIGS